MSASSWRLAFLVNLPLGVIAVVVARRALVESRSPGRRRMPDLRGATLLAVSLGLVTLAVIQGGDWGWASLAVLGAFAGSLLAFAGFVVSSRSHPAPILDTALFRVRSFAVGNLTTVVAGMGFYAYLLTHILFLTYVWNYSLLQAGLAVAPAAFVAAAVAAVLGRVADARGHRLVVIPGALLWAASFFWYLERVGSQPDFWGAWLPGQVLSGIGVGATLPILGAAALAVLPKGGGYATASAVVTSARQLGAVLGIALLVALVGNPGPADAEAALRQGWVLSAVCFLVVAVGAAFLGRTTAHPGDTAPLDAEAPAPLPAPPTPAQLPEHAPAPRQPDLLGDLPLFRGLSPEAQIELSNSTVDVELDAGSYLFRAGHPSDALYVVRSGRLQVVQNDVVLTELGRGGVLGELGLLTGVPRSASVRAVRDSRLVRLDRQQFAAFADAGVLTALATGLAVRLQEIEPPLASPVRPENVVVAVVGLDAAAPVAEVATALLGDLKRVLVAVDPGRVNRDGLERAERSCDRVLLAADCSDEGWREFCLRVADRVVVIAGESQPPTAPPYPRAVGADLVLVGGATRDQRIAWEALLQPVSTHSLDRATIGSGTRPLSDRLAGRSLGLVLAGGGARALAHLGVLDELQSAGIVVDRVAGTSLGAVIAAGHACGMDADAVDALVYEYFVRTNPIGDYTLPTKSFIRGRATETGLKTVFAGRVVEELTKEFRCVSVDLLARSAVVHRNGRVSDALACSLRVPGLYPPYQLNNRLHIDGGVLDNLPVRTLAGPEGPVVAVNISFGGSAKSGSKTPRSGPPRIPALGDTLMRTMMMGSGATVDQSLALADVVISPDAAGVGLLEFHQIDAMRESGRIAARASLPAIQALLARPSASREKM